MAELKTPVPLADMLRGCTKKWIEVLTAGAAAVELKTVLDTVTVRRHYPAAADIFAFARYSLVEAKFVILAMDPYPQPGVAHGLAFSSRGATCPTSLARIWSVLREQGLIKAVPSFDEKKMPEPHNLEHLAVQGGILLNCALTVEPQKPGSHIRLWQNYMDGVIRRLSAALPEGAIWCLWGSDAQKKEALINDRHQVLKWCHPTAMTDPSFAQCDHFTRISEKWPIVWDPTATATHFYTDGAGKNNQKTACRASWGVVCTKGLYKGRDWGDLTLTKTIVGPEPKAPKASKKLNIMGEKRDYKMRPDGLADIEARPTNIRAEGEALVKAMRVALGLPRRTPVTIHTDSKFWMTDMLGESSEREEHGEPKAYMREWQAQGIPWIHRANSDLTEAMWDAYTRVKEAGNIRLRFVNCWHDRKRPADGTQDLEWWLGNKAAEERAEAELD